MNLNDKNKFILNNIEFIHNEECNYKYNYEKIIYDLNKSTENNYKNTLRNLIREDLFSIIFFGLNIPRANSKFVVDMCREVEEGPKTRTLDIWARGHFKSTIITIAETIQKRLKNPERCSCLISYKKGAADRFLYSIRAALMSKFLINLFPDVLFENPNRESPSWSIMNGITLKRPNSDARPQKTIQTSGLVEGMLQGDHFEDLVFDDYETDDMKYSKEQMDLCHEKFKMALNLVTHTELDTIRIVGTFYSHLGPLIRLRDTLNINNEPFYCLRNHPATNDGTLDGNPVLLTKEQLYEKYIEIGDSVFYSQMMCDPTPRFAMQLDPELLIETKNKDIPNNLCKFMIIDSAGSTSTKHSQKDYWGIVVVGIPQDVDKFGSPTIYILDMYIDQVDEAEIVFTLANLYWRNSLIDIVAYEKLGAITPGWLLHFINTLQSRGIIVSEEIKNLLPLSHQNKEKKKRITSNLRLPLINGKIHYSDTIDSKYIDHFKEEMRLHPVWHDDGIDALSYVYQVMENYGFRWKINTQNKSSLIPNMYNSSTNEKNTWLSA